MIEESTQSVEATVREIRRGARKNIPPKKKCVHLHLRAGASVVLEGPRGEDTIAELCRREGIHVNMYYKSR